MGFPLIIDESLILNEAIKKDEYKKNFNEIITQQPEEKLMKHIDNFMVDLKQYYGENHYEHFLNFPAMVRLGLKKGYLDTSILKGRPEKSIDEFMEKKHVEKRS